MADIPSERGLLSERVRLLCAADEPHIDIAEAALALAALRHPGVDLEPYRAHLAAMGEAVADLVRRRGGPVDALRQIVALSYGYRGDQETYDDLQNADLIRVIDRRKGLPVALSIVYLNVARRQGWRCAGLAFPGHFLIRLEAEGARHVLDPFNGGVAREAGDMRRLLKSVAGEGAELAPAHFDEVPDRQVLLRLENNVKTRLVGREDRAGAAEAIERMLLIDPDRPELLLEAAEAHATADSNRAAIAALVRFLGAAASGDPNRPRAARLLQELRNRLN